MLKYSTTKGTFAKGNVNDGFKCSANNKLGVVFQTTDRSPSKLPSYAATSSTNNHIYNKWNGVSSGSLDNGHTTYNISEIIKVSYYDGV